MKKIAIILAIIVTIYSAITSTVRNHREIEALHNEYRTVQEEDELNGRITALYVSKGASFVTLGKKKVHINNSGNFLYQVDALYRLLEVGDVLEKNADSDTLFVHKPGKRFYFRIGKKINRK